MISQRPGASAHAAKPEPRIRQSQVDDSADAGPLAALGILVANEQDVRQSRGLAKRAIAGSTSRPTGTRRRCGELYPRRPVFAIRYSLLVLSHLALSWQELHCRTDIVRGELRIGSNELFGSIPVSDTAGNHAYRHARAFDTGTTMMDRRIDNDSIAPVHVDLD